MSVRFHQIAALVLDARVRGPALEALRKMRAKGVRRLPEEVFSLRRGRLGAAAAYRFLRGWLDGERLTRHNGQWVLNSFMPPFPGAAYNRLFDNMFSGRHLSPVSAFLAVTARCPARCPHCSHGGRRNGAELSTGETLDVIRQLHGLGASIIGFTGGEPCLRGDLPSLVRAASEGGAATILFTSGFGLTDALLAELREAGLWSVCVSIDSDTAQEHDAGRGEGSFAAVVSALRRAKAGGFYTMAGTLATPAFVATGRYRRVHDFLATLGAHEMRIVEAMPCGNLVSCADDAFLSTAQVAELRRFHADMNRRRGGPKVCAFNQVESPEVFGCGAGTQHLFIGPDGTVCPCDFTPLGFGSVRDAPLADLWRAMNLAMGDNPRTHCFVHKNRAAIRARADAGYPLPPDISEAICRAAAPEPLPGYFALVTQGGNGE
ncbi:MAG: radical SAM protein [Kiritimatiellaeota bacterium]|nr:radical SAM protein [Kiritimatiellota bacterium]